MSTDNAVRDLAYRLWEDAGNPHGQDMAFWLEAERRLAAAPKAKATVKPKAAPKPKTKAK